eukprot:scaffold5233_cov127-Isochrysis_galbana.AAC.3
MGAAGGACGEMQAGAHMQPYAMCARIYCTHMQYGRLVFSWCGLPGNASLLFLLLLLHLGDTFLVEPHGQVHLKDALHDEEIGKPVAHPDGQLVHPVRRDEHVVPDGVDSAFGVLARGRHHERSTLLGRHLGVGEDHRGGNPERRLALEVDAFSLVLAVARPGQVLDVALGGRVAGEEGQRKARGRR